MRRRRSPPRRPGRSGGSRHAEVAPLPKAFYDRPTLEVAADLLGKVLVHRASGRPTAGRIVEAEAYIGEDDPACHAAAGRTRRNAPLYGPPGLAYVYLNYGIHFLFNVVTEAEGRPAAVLIRALEPVEGLDADAGEARGRPERPGSAGPRTVPGARQPDSRHGDRAWRQPRGPVGAALVCRGARRRSAPRVHCLDAAGRHLLGDRSALAMLCEGERGGLGIDATQDVVAVGQWSVASENGCHGVKSFFDSIKGPERRRGA